MNLELRLMAVMLKTGDFGPLMRDEITEEHFETDEGKVLYNFVTTYRNASEGAARFPSLSIVRSRFSRTAVELPEPDEGDRVDALTHEVKLAKFRSELRQLSLEAEQIANSAKDPVISAIPLAARLRKATEQQQRVQHISLAEGIVEVANQYKNKEIQKDGIPYPWPILTRETRGLQGGELTIFCGRPKSRKTFTALRVATHAVKNQHRVLVFSPEMAVKQCFLRCVAHYCELPYRELKDGSMAPEDEARLFAAVEEIGRSAGMDDAAYQLKLSERIPNLGDLHPSLDVVMSAGRDITWMASQIDLYRPTLIISDSFYLQRAAGQKRLESDYKAVGAVSRELKQLALEYNIPIIATHQLNREAQRNIGDLSNLALADAVGQDADAIYRVVTGKLDSQPVSALLCYAAREVAFDGVLINNVPCTDYSEIGAITSRKQVLELMKQEDDADGDTPRARGQRPGGPAHVPNIRGARSPHAPRVQGRIALNIGKANPATLKEQESLESVSQAAIDELDKAS